MRTLSTGKEADAEQDVAGRSLDSSKARHPTARGEFLWVWVGLGVLLVVSAICAPGTLTRSSITAMLPFAGVLAIVATGQTLVIQQRGIDMSAIGTVSLAGVLASRAGFAFDSVLLAVAFTAIVCVFVGLVSGALVSKLAINPLVATLAVNALVIGAVRTLTGNASINVPTALQSLAHGQAFDIPANVLFACGIVISTSIIATKAVVGRRFVAVGVSPRAAEAAGIRVAKYQIAAYVASALCCCVGGILLAGYIGSASTALGNDYLMPAIAAVVVGGTPLTGGKGSIVASAAAALFMTQLGQMVLALGAGTSIQLLVQACAIPLAMALRYLPAVLRKIKLKSS
jgi:ribose transport system permease protein